jgi:hypothetical protein
MFCLHVSVKVIFPSVALPETATTTLLAEKLVLPFRLVHQTLTLVAIQVLLERKGLGAVSERAREDDLVV